MHARVAALAAVFLAATAYTHYRSVPERVPPIKSLDSFPRAIGEWEGRDAPFSAGVVQVLGVDDYLNRVYATKDGAGVALYIGYYRSQRSGDTMHSPMNCMPGAGWQPAEHARVALTVGEAGAARTIVVNEYVVEKGADRQVLLYWYQSQGRVVAGEFASRAYMVYDAMRHNRTDAALVRVLSPVSESEPDGRAAAAARARALVRAVFSDLNAWLPS